MLSYEFGHASSATYCLVEKDVISDTATVIRDGITESFTQPVHSKHWFRKETWLQCAASHNVDLLMWTRFGTIFIVRTKIDNGFV